MNQVVNKPSPITGGQMELRVEPASVEYRGETIFYEKSYYLCLDSGMEFMDEELEASNLKRICDTYRHIHPFLE